MSKKQLTYEQEVEILHFIEYCQGKSTHGDCRGYMYEIYQMFMNDGRNAGVCSCLDRDTARKVNNFIGGYSFSDEIRFTDRFHKLLPHLALVREEVIEEESTVDVKVDMSKFTKKKTTKAKSVPVKPVRRKKK